MIAHETGHSLGLVHGSYRVDGEGSHNPETNSDLMNRFTKPFQRIRDKSTTWKELNLDYLKFLMIAFPAIAVFAEHLAIVRQGLAATTPRGDVIRLHTFKREGLPVFLANAFLVLIRNALLTQRKSPNAQILLLPGQHIRINAFLV